MINEEPSVAKNGRYPIGKAARLLGISRNTLRTYADSGVIKSSVSRVNGRRIFLGIDLLYLWRTHI